MCTLSGSGPLPLWRSTSMWELHQQIRIACVNKLKANWIQETLAKICSGIILSSHLSSWNKTIEVYSTVILPVVLYWCGIWSLTRKNISWTCSRIECWGRYVDSRGKGELWGCRQLHFEERMNVYSLPNVIREIKTSRWDGWGMWGRIKMHAEF